MSGSTVATNTSNASDPVVWTTMGVLKWSVQHLISKKFSSPRLDTELLLSHALGCTRVQLYTQFEKPLTEDERGRFRGYLRRRLNQEPVAYITGHREFFGRDFLVNSSVLIPRPDSELLVEHVLESQKNLPAEVSILDLCSGSGCLAISLAAELPQSTVRGVDVSEPSLKVAIENSVILGVSDRLKFSKADVFVGIGDLDIQSYDWIVSNPPYIPKSDLLTLDATVRDFEPSNALDGGDDGFLFYRSLIPMAHKHLKLNGSLAVEIGIGQAHAVRNMFEETGFSDVKVIPDLAGIERVVSGVRK